MNLVGRKKISKNGGSRDGGNKNQISSINRSNNSSALDSIYRMLNKKRSTKTAIRRTKNVNYFDICCVAVVFLAVVLSSVDEVHVTGQRRNGLGKPYTDSYQLLQRLLHQRDKLRSTQNRKLNINTRARGRLSIDADAVERQIFDRRGRSSGTRDQDREQPSVIYPEARKEAIRRYLDEAKEQLDVIDFHQRSDPGVELEFGDGTSGRGQASEQVPIKLALPNINIIEAKDLKKDLYDDLELDLGRPSRSVEKFEKRSKNKKKGCTNCVEEGPSGPNRYNMPLTKLGSKQYYMGIFFKANWYKAEQYCRFHGMSLASINSADEQKYLEEHIQAYGMGHEHFWTSGTDQGEEGKFFWLSNGKPLTYTNWNAGEPNNFKYEDGEEEHCLEMWDRDGKGLGWNDTPCSFQTFFICES